MVSIDGMQTIAATPQRRRLAPALDALRADAGLYLVIALYLLFAEIVMTLAGREVLGGLIARYLAVWAVLAGVALGAMAIVRGAARLRGGAARAFARPGQILAGVVLYFAVAVFMGAFTSVKMSLSLVQPFQWDPFLANLDRIVHFGHDPWVLLQPWLGHLAVTRAIEFCYSPGWCALVFLAPLFAAVAPANRRLRDQYLWAFLLAWIINGTVMAALLLSGGPAFYGMLTGDTHRFAELVRYLALDAGNFVSAAQEQAMLIDAYRHQGPVVGAGISDFPSMHVTMVMLCTFAAWRLGRVFGVLASLFAVIIVVGSVHLGWHYAVGDYYAIASSFLIWRLGGWIAARLAPPPAASGLATP
jgi:hypothetical protein